LRFGGSRIERIPQKLKDLCDKNALPKFLIWRDFLPIA
jgi:hypothetical protein